MRVVPKSKARRASEPKMVKVLREMTGLTRLMRRALSTRHPMQPKNMHQLQPINEGNASLPRLVPKDTRPTPRYPGRGLDSYIEAQLKAKPTERDPFLRVTLVTQPSNNHKNQNGTVLGQSRDLQNYAREFMVVPDSMRVDGTKGKVKWSIRKMHRDEQEHKLEVSYAAPMRPRARPLDQPVISNASQSETAAESETTRLEDDPAVDDSVKISPRQERLSTQMRELISRIIQTQFPADPILKPTNLFITSVQSRPDLTLTLVKWYPVPHPGLDHASQKYTNWLTKQRARIERALCHAGPKIRYKVTEELKYLRLSPQIVFEYDQSVDEQRKLDERLSSLASNRE